MAGSGTKMLSRDNMLRNMGTEQFDSDYVAKIPRFVAGAL